MNKAPSSINYTKQKDAVHHTFTFSDVFLLLFVDVVLLGSYPSGYPTPYVPNKEEDPSIPKKVPSNPTSSLSLSCREECNWNTFSRKEDSSRGVGPSKRRGLINGTLFPNSA